MKTTEDEEIMSAYNEVTILKPLIAERAAALNAKKYVLMSELDDLMKIVFERHKRSQAEVGEFLAKNDCSVAEVAQAKLGTFPKTLDAVCSIKSAEVVRTTPQEKYTSIRNSIFAALSCLYLWTSSWCLWEIYVCFLCLSDTNAPFAKIQLHQHKFLYIRVHAGTLGANTPSK